MMSVACFNLDTRRDSFATTVDLDRADTFVDVLAFEVPDEVVGETSIALASHGERLLSGEAVGWRTAEGLAARAFARAGARLTLALRREDLARAVAATLGRGNSDGAAVVTVAFTTIMDTPRGPKASARRTALVTVLAGASKPDLRLEASAIDLDAPTDGRLTAARLSLALPADLALEARRGILLELGCVGLAAEHLMLSVAGHAEFAATTTPVAGAAAGASRWLVAFPDADSAAGRTLALRIAISRDALLDRVEDMVRIDPDAAPQMRLSVKASGWTDGAAEADEASPRRWATTLEAPAIPLVSGRRDDAVFAIFGVAAACAFDGEAGTLAAEAPVTADVEPDDESETVRLAPLAIEALRWPLTRAARLVVRVAATVEGERVVEAPIALPLEIVRLGASGRRGRVVVALRALAERLSRAARSGGRAALPRGLKIEVEIVTVDAPERVLLRAAAPVVFVRRVRRQPIVIDFGASATAVWAGAPETGAAPAHVRPLPIGAWLARHLGGADDGEPTLIASTVGLDPRRNLRAESLPHTLPDLALARADREAATGRMRAFGRRYDVSVPAPARRHGAAPDTRRIDGLKRALAGGETAIRLADPVQRHDAATGRTVATNTVEVAALTADMLDELDDLYVLRLAPESGADDSDPAPVAPRIVLTRPAGVADEMERRWRPTLDLFRRRLERLYPGAGAFSDLVTTAPEGVAAARTVASMLGDVAQGPGGGDTLLVTLDIGGGSSDVAVARIARAGDRRPTFDVVASFGVAFGGDAIDEALASAVAARIDAAMAAQTTHWRQTFEEPSLARLDSRDDPTALALRRTLRAAVSDAKAALTARLLAAAEALGSPYAWSGEDGAATFDIVLAASDDGHEGLFAPRGAPSLSDEAVGLALEHEPDGAGWRLLLRLRRAEVESAAGPHGARLKAATEALGVTLLRMARAAGPTPSRRPTLLVVPTGRGALWPPLFEAIAAEAAAARDPLPFPRPFAPTAMKSAVVGGAALLAADGGLADIAPERRNPLAVVAIGARMRRLDQPGVATEFVAERLLYLGQDGASAAGRIDLGRRFHVVRAVPGLDPAGRTLAALRPLLGGGAPLILLDGDAVVDARREGLDAFGQCDVTSETTGPSERRIVVASPAEGWEACWTVTHDRVVRLY